MEKAKTDRDDTATTEIYTLSLHDALPISTEVLDRAQLGHNRSGSPSATLADIAERKIGRAHV